MSIFKLDSQTIKKAINLLHPNEELFEIRIINGNYNASGYFRNAETAIRALQNYQASYRKDELAKASNIFITMNPVDNTCYARKQHDQFIENVKPTTGDKEITRLHWFLIDLDPKRMSGVSSSATELESARARAREIYSFLQSRGWKKPIVAMSGNGMHLVYRYNEENTAENVKLWETALKVLHDKFSDDTVDVDITVYNPARICKLWGTVAQKGFSLPERPHRKAYIENSTPEMPEINDISFLKNLIKDFPIDESVKVPAPAQPIPARIQAKSSKKNQFDLDEFIFNHNIPVREIVGGANGETKYVLEHCLFDESHGGKDAAIIQRADGTLCYHCFHNSCADKHWHDVRLKYEPDAYDYMDYSPRKKAEKPKSPYDIDGTGMLSMENLEHYLKVKGYQVRYNIIKHELEYLGFPDYLEGAESNSTPILIKNELQKHLKKCSVQSIMDFLTLIGRKNRINPILEKIKSTEWDGIDRIQQIYEMFQIDETDTLSRTLFKKWLMQTVCGLYNKMGNPFSLDIVLVFQGEQGVGKTRFFQHLADLHLNRADYFGEGVCLDPRNKDSIIESTAKWICELGEIGSTMKKDIDIVKAVLSRAYDEYRPAYARSAIRYARMTSFVGTVNDVEFLIDQTGNRRFATIPLKQGVKIDVKNLKNFDSLQLWAQVYALVQNALEEGETYSSCFRLTDEEKKALDERNHSFTKPMKGEKEVEDIIADQMTPEQGYVLEEREMTTTEFKENFSVLSKYSTSQIAKVLEKLGYTMYVKHITKPDGSRSSKKVRKLPYKDYAVKSQHG